MTRQEFNEMQAAVLRTESRRALIVVAAGAVVVLAVVLTIKPLLGYIEEHAMDWIGYVKPYGFKGVLGFFVFALTLLVWSVRPPKGVPCPNCHKPIFGIAARLLRITGNCSHCGERILSA
ncbi:MAG: hypothetical protein EPO07_13645 [Verrucomicrobia bacterium]|nr:MAG: hypothetical protein EPO07_13645 [Verrucomicrobiota bacterium]